MQSTRAVCQCRAAQALKLPELGLNLSSSSRAAESATSSQQSPEAAGEAVPADAAPVLSLPAVLLGGLPALRPWQPFPAGSPPSSVLLLSCSGGPLCCVTGGRP